MKNIWLRQPPEPEGTFVHEATRQSHPDCRAAPKFPSAARSEFSVAVTFSTRNAREVSRARVDDTLEDTIAGGELARPSLPCLPRHRSQGLRGSAPPMGRGAHLRVARALPQARERLGENHRLRDRHGLHRQHPPPNPPHRKVLQSLKEFRVGLSPLRGNPFI
jgi:hypothetical protein